MPTWKNKDIFASIEGDIERVMKQSSLSVNELPKWWESAFHKISLLMKLSDNWDSYGAKKVDPDTAYYAVQILQQIARPDVPGPSIVPTVRGFLQFEWHINGVDLEFEVISPTEINVSYENAVTGDEWERTLDYNLTPLTQALVTLVGNQNIQGRTIGHA